MHVCGHCCVGCRLSTDWSNVASCQDLAFAPAIAVQAGRHLQGQDGSGVKSCCWLQVFLSSPAASCGNVVHTRWIPGISPGPKKAEALCSQHATCQRMNTSVWLFGAVSFFRLPCGCVSKSLQMGTSSNCRKSENMGPMGVQWGSNGGPQIASVCRTCRSHLVRHLAWLCARLAHFCFVALGSVVQMGSTRATGGHRKTSCLSTQTPQDLNCHMNMALG
jgi:hypothetical protein